MASILLKKQFYVWFQGIRKHNYLRQPFLLLRTLLNSKIQNRFWFSKIRHQVIVHSSFGTNLIGHHPMTFQYGRLGMQYAMRGFSIENRLLSLHTHTKAMWPSVAVRNNNYYYRYCVWILVSISDNTDCFKIFFES